MKTKRTSTARRGCCVLSAQTWLTAACTWTLATQAILGQGYLPATITSTPGDPQSQVRIQWPTTPGRIYEIRTTDALGQPWVTTNVGPITARSTVSQFVESTELDARFYRVWEQAVPPGSTAAITTATVAEAEKLLGLTFTPAERSQMLELLNNNMYLNRSAYQAMRRMRLLNSDPPPLVFNPLPIGFTKESTQRPIIWSPPAVVAVPSNRVDLAFCSVRDLGELIRSRQISSVELTRLYLERLKTYDSKLHCVITLTEELALRQAAQADTELAAGKYRGPLHGIPYGLKDLFATRGYCTTWGAAPYRDQLIDEDAAVVRRLEEAGAVLVAKLSLGSLAMGDVWFGGQTRNPWNLSEGSSGSSAGPAAATAAGVVPFAIGTETIGSIVSPCTRCRVTGLRPTFGRVSRTGAMTLSWSMDKIGPICRTVEDCALVFESIRGADGLDQAVIEAPFNYDPKRDVRTLRVGIRGVSSTTRSCLAALVGESHLVNFTLPNYPYQAMSLICDTEAAAAFDELTRFNGDAYLTSQGTWDWPNDLRVARTVPAVEYLQANRLRQKLIQDMAAVLEDIDLYVTPGTDEASSFITNLTGHPCVVIPNGGASSLSFIGKPLDEATILILAKAYQNATSFHTGRPAGFSP
jgi:Asp-tRNA(Asn)/Glu-tRNA(Gln) amidotransferase A subunit family amidase